jgi:magnesium-transporting ATPase (P-type)
MISPLLMWAILFSIIAVVILVATSVIHLLVLVYTEDTASKPEKQSGYRNVFLPFYIIALISSLLSFYLFVQFFLAHAFGNWICVIWMVLPFFILLIYLDRHRHGIFGTTQTNHDNSSLSNECTHRVWISEHDINKITDVEHLAEHTCTSCGSHINLITLKGIQSPEDEPWRIFCANCEQEVDVDQL